jgi:Uma2 family endonuclease
MAQVLKNKEQYTYADYLTWNDGVRYELIDGVAYALAAPSTIHQRILRKLSTTIDNFLDGKSCELFVAPYDVRLNTHTFDNMVVQPDLSVICDKLKIDERGCVGAPDLVIEILSPTTARRDLLLKFNIYLEAGVKEYWIVDPESNTVDVFIFENEKYIRNEFTIEGDKIKSNILQGIEIDLSEVFSEV